MELKKEFVVSHYDLEDQGADFDTIIADGYLFNGSYLTWHVGEGEDDAELSVDKALMKLGAQKNDKVIILISW